MNRVTSGPELGGQRSRLKKRLPDQREAKMEWCNEEVFVECGWISWLGHGDTRFGG